MPHTCGLVGIRLAQVSWQTSPSGRCLLFVRATFNGHPLRMENSPAHSEGKKGIIQVPVVVLWPSKQAVVSGILWKSKNLLNWSMPYIRNTASPFALLGWRWTITLLVLNVSNIAHFPLVHYAALRFPVYSLPACHASSQVLESTRETREQFGLNSDFTNCERLERSTGSTSLAMGVLACSGLSTHWEDPQRGATRRWISTRRDVTLPRNWKQKCRQKTPTIRFAFWFRTILGVIELLGVVHYSYSMVSVSGVVALVWASPLSVPHIIWLRWAFGFRRIAWLWVTVCGGGRTVGSSSSDS